MRNFILGLMIGVLFTLTAVAFGEDKPVKIVLDGRDVYTDVAPQIINGRTFVPVKFIAEALGIDVKWDDNTRSVILTSPENLPPFSVVSYNKVDNEYGFALLGEVKNNSGKTFRDVELKAEVLDAEGNVVEKLSTSLPPGITGGETAYFKLRAYSGNRLFNSVNFSFSTSDECSIAPAEVAFSGVRFERDPNIYIDFIYVTGEVERADSNSREYEHPTVQIALFDTNGKMVNCGERKMDDYKDSKYGEFKITLENGPAYATYKLKLFSD